ncbi:MAG: hypothetical protein JSW73_01505 [Candidatus Woesearchaeota archaeon]|nr:MAG: hypothetical protein JSW73_01505 [Candidatus Woesearchaeota archaeon]
MIRKASLVDIDKIKRLEMNYYSGSHISERILVKWIKNGNFFVIEEDSRIVGSIYFEFLDEIKDLPWEHDPIGVESGKYIYISEIAVDSKERIPILFEKVSEAANGCEGIIWLTGERSNHDKIEYEFVKNNGFKRYKHITYWECAPDRFVNDHTLYTKKSEAIPALEL